MTNYEKIERYLEDLNAKQDINIQIDDIDELSVTFSVYDSEVTGESLQTICEVLEWINKKSDLNTMSDITHYPSKNGSQECFNLRFLLDVGEDYESEEEMHQRSLDDAEERRYEEYKESKLE